MHGTSRPADRIPRPLIHDLIERRPDLRTAVDLGADEIALTVRSTGTRCRMVVRRLIGTSQGMRSCWRSSLSKHIILFFAADPLGTTALARTIQDELERSGQRDRFELVTRWAVHPLDLIRELRKLKPTVVHFSGQPGSGAGTSRDIQAEFGRPDGVADSDHLGGLFLPGPDGHPQPVTAVALQETFGATGASVKLVVLNACYRDIHVEALLVHIDCVVAMGRSLRDDAARAFAAGFYGGLGERQSVAAAYMQGCAAISLTAPSDCERPRLAVRAGIDASEVVLADTRAVDRGTPIPAEIARDHVDREIHSHCRRSSMAAFNRRQSWRTTFSAPRVVRTPGVDPSRSSPDAIRPTHPFAAPERSEQPRKVTTEPRRWWRYAGAGVTAAAAAVVALVVLLPAPPALALNIELMQASQFRGDEPKVGDVARITVSSGKGPGSIWVCREGVQLLLRCPGDPNCRVSDASTEVDLKLTSVGIYNVVALDTAAVAPLIGDCDVDTAAARDAGIDVRRSHLTVKGLLHYQPRSTSHSPLPAQ
jgi:hypothetical protein